MPASSLEIVDVMRAVLPAALRGAERGIACRADDRVVIDLAAHHHRLAPPEAGHPRPFAGQHSTASCWLPRYSLPFGGRRAAVVALPSASTLLLCFGGSRSFCRSSRRRYGSSLDGGRELFVEFCFTFSTRDRCDLDQLPRQFLQLFPGQIREPLAVHVTQLICSEMRHIAC